jgi:hypothetical protein
VTDSVQVSFWALDTTRGSQKVARKAIQREVGSGDSSIPEKSLNKLDVVPGETSARLSSLS